MPSRNQVPETTFTAVLPDAEVISSWAGSAEWVVANILAGPLVDLAPDSHDVFGARGATPVGRAVGRAGRGSDRGLRAGRWSLAVADQQEEWVLLAGARR